MGPIKIRLSFHRRFLWQQYKCKKQRQKIFMLLVVFGGKKIKHETKEKTEMEPFNMSDLASHDKFHLATVCVSLCVCVSWRMPNVCSITMKFSILSVLLKGCMSLSVCVYVPFMIIVSCWQNLFIWFAPSLVYLPPGYVCVCVHGANKNYVKTCKYALTFDLWMTNDMPPLYHPPPMPFAHVCQLLIMITLVTVSFVVNNGLVGLEREGGGSWV